MDPQDSVVLTRTDQKAGGHEDMIVLGLAIDMLDAVDALDDGL